MSQHHAVITDELLARARGRIGQVWTPREAFFNTQATRDTIRHFCNGIGDVNPLHRDPAYAAKTRYGCLVAPPCFLYSVYLPSGAGGAMPGIHGWHAGNDWDWKRVILEGDEFTYSVMLTDVIEKQGQRAGRSIVTRDETTYRDQKGEIVAMVKGWAVRVERAAAGEKARDGGTAKAGYTPEDIERIYADYDREEVRGGNPRYWEDVNVGDELKPVVKGPLALRDIFAWIMGGGSPYIKAHRIFLAYQRRHPAVGMIDSRTGQVDVPELVHMESTRAQEVGIPTAYDYGPQRISWLGHLMTNWMSDEGRLKRLRAELRSFNVVGDTTWCKGKVTRKYESDSEHLVECEIYAENQRGQRTAPATATVALPSKTK